MGSFHVRSSAIYVVASESDRSSDREGVPVMRYGTRYAKNKTDSESAVQRY